MSKIKLKPCPFCGEGAEIVNRKRAWAYAWGKELEWVCEILCSSISSLECPAAKNKYPINEDLAIEKWNRRVGDDK